MPATTNKQQLLEKALVALKKKFPAPPAPTDKRPILEEVIYGICREGVPSAIADIAYANLRKAFFDWNEIRVSTIPEVEDVLGQIPHAGVRAKCIVDFLQEHFEQTYSFELDIEKKGLKQAAKQLSRYKRKGVSDFVVAWVTQRALGGHAIPLDAPTIRLLQRLGVLDEDIDLEDLETVRASLEHFVAKSKDYDFTEETIQLAVTLCVETPICKDCPLKADCPTGIENLSKKDKKDDKSKKAK
ncbi:MAG: endonuclease III domain-containing protein [Fimbriiglobus sp.]